MNLVSRDIWFLFLILVLPLAQHVEASEKIRVGSKIFTEGYILGEIAAQAIENQSHQTVVRKLGLGSTGVSFEALKSGSIDVYADYTGTLAEAILKKPHLREFDEVRSALLSMGLTISDPLGFNNTYALAAREDFAKENQLKSIDDLRRTSEFLRAAFSYEFMDRSDGYRGMIDRYQLQFNPDQVHRMEHSLVYQAIHERSVDLIEVYSTDSKIFKFNLRVLEDTRNYFPVYQAVWVARSDFVKSHPEEWGALLKLKESITEKHMIWMNGQADIDHKSFEEIAATFLGVHQLAKKEWLSKFTTRTQEHLTLVGVSLIFSILIGIPLGILSVRYQRLGQVILLLSALIQTVPSLALLCFLIPVFGVGIKPALVALCLYSLLPVVMNTYIGIRSIDAGHIENARAFGLNRTQILLRIVLPLSSPALLAGVRTATIVSIGTATLAALVGAGGFGADIVSGLALNDSAAILNGAIPAAILAIGAHFLFEGIEKIVIPPGLQKA